jgi:sugar lactone lactonase YvrE
MTTDIGGNLYVADVNGAVRKVTSSGSHVFLEAGIVSDNAVLGSVSTIVQFVYSLNGIAVSTSGTIYVSASNYIASVTGDTRNMPLAHSNVTETLLGDN